MPFLLKSSVKIEYRLFIMYFYECTPPAAIRSMPPPGELAGEWGMDRDAAASGSGSSPGRTAPSSRPGHGHRRGGPERRGHRPRRSDRCLHLASWPESGGWIGTQLHRGVDLHQEGPRPARGLVMVTGEVVRRGEDTARGDPIDASTWRAGRRVGMDRDAAASRGGSSPGGPRPARGLVMVTGEVVRRGEDTARGDPIDASTWRAGRRVGMDRDAAASRGGSSPGGPRPARGLVMVTGEVVRRGEDTARGDPVYASTWGLAEEERVDRDAAASGGGSSPGGPRPLAAWSWSPASWSGEEGTPPRRSDRCLHLGTGRRGESGSGRSCIGEWIFTRKDRAQLAAWSWSPARWSGEERTPPAAIRIKEAATVFFIRFVPPLLI